MKKSTTDPSKHTSYPSADPVQRYPQAKKKDSAMEDFEDYLQAHVLRDVPLPKAMADAGPARKEILKKPTKAQLKKKRKTEAPEAKAEELMLDPSIPVLECSKCNRKKQRKDYSKKQWKKGRNGKPAGCKACLSQKPRAPGKGESKREAQQGDEKTEAVDVVNLMAKDSGGSGGGLNYDPLDPKLMEVQPTINVLAGGHVSHGKSTLMTALSGKQMMQRSDEKKGSKTIDLGYMSFKIYRCGGCEPPDNYHPMPSKTKTRPSLKCSVCGCTLELLRHLAFLDAPGHFEYFFTMLTGVKTVDAMLLVAAVNEKWTGAKDERPRWSPAPQTVLHTNAAYLLDGPISNLVVVQNKVDLMFPDRMWLCAEHNRALQHFLAKYGVHRPAIIPASATFGLGIKSLCHALVCRVKPRKVDLQKPLNGRVVRSFDVNEPNTHALDLSGGVIGCIIKDGVLREGMKLEIRPGMVWSDGRVMPLFCRVTRVESEGRRLKTIYPGCSVGIGTNLDPYLTKANRLCGNIVGVPGTLPPVFKRCVVRMSKRPPGVPVKKFTKGEVMFVVVGSMRRAVVKKTKSQLATVEAFVEFKFPVCAEDGALVILCRGVGTSMKVYGSATLTKMRPIELSTDGHDISAGVDAAEREKTPDLRKRSDGMESEEKLQGPGSTDSRPDGLLFPRTSGTNPDEEKNSSTEAPRVYSDPAANAEEFYARGVAL